MHAICARLDSITGSTCGQSARELPMKTKTIAGLIAVALLAGTACAEMKTTGRQIGHTTRDVTRDIGHATRDAAKTVGHTTRDVTREVGHTTRDAVKKVGSGVKDATSSDSE
mgnify:FL=1